MGEKSKLTWITFISLWKEGIGLTPATTNKTYFKPALRLGNRYCSDFSEEISLFKSEKATIPL
jgi:hypothetical protein